jgi:hypothetical protein
MAIGDLSQLVSTALDLFNQYAGQLLSIIGL